ncbi:MAG: hypothetical protein Q7R80_00085 [bacterium]|nr:hypothetical protein [bacterium]
MQLRKEGTSIVAIESRLGIPRSTLSGWFRGIHLNRQQEERLLRNKHDALNRARGKASEWHRRQKQQRIEFAHLQAREALEMIDERNPAIIELALALLYLGEGSKKTVETAMGNSDPMVLRFFLSVLRKVYSLDVRNVRCELSLRADQDSERMKRYWATELGLSTSCFKRIHLDQRTVGSPTYPHYKGVCYVRCGNVAIQRRLLSLAEQFCHRTIEGGERSE